MKELEQVLRLHAARYPLMQPTDAVKLIYQNEFGGGHLITDEQAFFSYLHREFSRTVPDPAAALYEDIGNSILRVNLAAVKETDLDALGRAFIRSAAAHKGSAARFEEKLSVLRALAEESIFPFDAKQLEAYLAEYKEAGYPPVSHSQAYRDAYRPAYRIVSKAFLP